MNKDENRSFEDEEVTVTLTLDDGELECSVLTILEADGREYIALLPLSGEDAENGKVYLYRYIDNGDGEPDLENITDDDEFEAASDAFNEYLDAQEFDELITEEED